ncbi:MAG: type I-U CRISPR-associated helicase/endonuclease Cas3 [Thermoplasmata archaeon]|nr:type I-U CRISPR-associated helicase/endonuclease Cas3 [Thermoplasmata archaeon]
MLQNDNEHQWIANALGLKNDDAPFPWQLRLYDDFKKGKIHRLLDIPTGLGKTGIMALWLVARAVNAPLPRRLIYIVDRRAVVDQATKEALKLREFVENTPEIKKKLRLDTHKLPISTLRGQFTDNREWLENPTLPAIIVGTIDMIGSRLLFEGYGVSRKMRPYHAALLGTDTLFVLDEAHLVPPFEKLLETIADNRTALGPHDDSRGTLISPFKFMAMSATGQQNSGSVFSIDEEDLRDGTKTARRLNATKRIIIEDIEEGKDLSDVLAERAWVLANEGKTAVKIVVFCDKRTDAMNVKKEIEKRAKGNKKEGVPAVKIESQLLVGARRVYEREMVANWLKAHGFIAGSDIPMERPTFLIATSAGEVGVDLDADHMVSDLVAWERMVQRLGRVNRFGNGDANVKVIVSYDKKIKDKEREMLNSTRKLFEALPEKNGIRSGSPQILCNLKSKATTDDELKSLFEKAITPSPLRPALTRPLVDAWSMTSLKEHTGRPEIGPWLRGWVDDKPRVSVIWRKYLPIRWCGNRRIEVSSNEIESFFEVARPHMSEMLETESFQVVDWLKKRAKKLEPDQKIGTSIDLDKDELTELPSLQEDDIVAIILSPAGDFKKSLTLSNLLQKEEKLEDLSSSCAIVLDIRIGGLRDGLLDQDEKSIPRTTDDGQPWMQDNSETTQTVPIIQFRVRTMKEGMDGDADTQWHESPRFPTKVTEDDEPVEWFVIEKWGGRSRSTGYLQLLDVHKEEVEKRAQSIADGLSLPKEYADMLRITAKLHDEGKRASHWQMAFNAPHDGIYAKTKGLINQNLLDNYRHELGSLLEAEKDKELLALPQDFRELALHLIISHHGYARPIITTHGCDEAPPSVLNEKTKEISLRFARLQKQWGPWGLAWWESLLRAADQQASREGETPELIKSDGGP